MGSRNLLGHRQCDVSLSQRREHSWKRTLEQRGRQWHTAQVDGGPRREESSVRLDDTPLPRRRAITRGASDLSTPGLGGSPVRRVTAIAEASAERGRKRLRGSRSRDPSQRRSVSISASSEGSYEYSSDVSVEVVSPTRMPESRQEVTADELSSRYPGAKGDSRRFPGIFKGLGAM